MKTFKWEDWYYVMYTSGVAMLFESTSPTHPRLGKVRFPVRLLPLSQRDDGVIMQAMPLPVVAGAEVEFEWYGVLCLAPFKDLDEAHRQQVEQHITNIFANYLSENDQ